MKKLLRAIIAVVMVSSCFFSMASAEGCPYTWNDFENKLYELNQYCGEYWVYADAKDGKADFIEIWDDLDKVSPSKYDFAIMRIKKIWYDETYFWEWENRDGAYYTIYESNEGKWTVFAVVHSEGSVFTKVGYNNGAWFLDNNKDIYRSK